MYDKIVIWDNVSVGFTNNTLVLVNILFVCSLFGIGLGLDIASYFKKDVLKIKPVLTALVCHILLFPALVCLILILLQDFIPSYAALGTLLAACCPISSRVFHRKHRHTDSNVLNCTFGINMLICFITLPLSFTLWSDLYVTYLEQDADTMLNAIHIDFLFFFRSFFLLFVLPISIGVVCRNRWPKQSAILAKPLLTFTQYFWLLLAVFVLAINYKFVLPRLGYYILIAIAFHLLGILTGSGVNHLFRFSRQERRSILLSTTVFGSGFGLALLMNRYVFPPETVFINEYLILASLTLWNALSMIINRRLLAIIDNHNEKKAFASNL